MPTYDVTEVTEEPPLGGVPLLPPYDTTEPPLAGDIMPETGDINLDGRVDVTDLSTLSIYLADRPDTWSSYQLSVADIDGDGKVTLADLAWLRMILVGIQF